MSDAGIKLWSGNFIHRKKGARLNYLICGGPQVKFKGVQYQLGLTGNSPWTTPRTTGSTPG
jgi:hypothetical protein